LWALGAEGDLRCFEAKTGKLYWSKNILKDNGAETNFYWYVTIMCAIAFVASILMPNPKVKGYLQGEGTEY